MTDLEIPATGSAEVHVLHQGYAGRDGDDERVSGTVTLIIDGDAVIVVDPGMVADRGALLAALTARGPRPEDVTDVVQPSSSRPHCQRRAVPERQGP